MADIEKVRLCFLKKWLSAVLGAVVLSVQPGADLHSTVRAATSGGVEGGVSERVQGIAATVEQIRGLSFTNRIRVGVQTEKELKEYVREQVAEQFGEQNSRYYVEALVRLGALEEPVDLADWMYEFVQEQAAAHYVPEDDVYYLVQTNMSPRFLDVVTAHELCHALQDHNFDLERFMKSDPERIRDNGDLALARQCLVEGEATWVMTAWMVMDQLNQTSISSVEPVVSMALNAQAAMRFEEIVDLTAEASGAEAGLTGMPAMDMDRHPRFFVEQLMAAYIQGAVMVDRLRGSNGWSGVSRLYYSNAVCSTEQILHPEKLAAGGKGDPVPVDSGRLDRRLSDGWQMVERDVMGELGMRVLFDIWRKEEGGELSPEEAAEGWGGDSYFYYTRKNGGDGRLLVWKTVWDSQKDAGEFATAYRGLIKARFPSCRVDSRGNNDAGSGFRIWRVDENRFIKMVRQGRMVGILDADSKEMMDVLWPRKR